MESLFGSCGLGSGMSERQKTVRGFDATIEAALPLLPLFSCQDTPNLQVRPSRSALWRDKEKRPCDCVSPSEQDS